MSNGQATLDIQSGGSLTSLGDATIASGLLNVDGVFNSADLMLFQGILTGTGLVNPTFLTNVAGAIAPNGAENGMLTVQGDVILASASDLFMEVSGDGADMLRIFDTWKNPRRIIELAEPVVLVRPPDTRASLLAALPSGYAKEEWSPRLIELPVYLSATQIRQRVGQGLPISGFVHPAVERYIAEQGLYGAT